KYQNQALKSGQHDQVLNDESNKAKIKKEINVLKTINIELEYKVANFRKENETLKKHYKDLYDSIKITRSRTIEQTTSLLANNADLKAQIQEKKGIDEMIEQRSDGTLYYLSRIWVPLKGDMRTLIMNESYKLKYFVHPGADKMYYDLRDRIAMDFVIKFPRNSSRHDTVWVIVDRLTKFAHFLPMHEDYKMDRLDRLYLNEIVARHVNARGIRNSFRHEYGLPPSDRCVRCAAFEALYGRKYPSSIMWAEIGEGAVRFRKKGKLAPRFVRPFEIVEKVGHVSYRLDLPEEMNGVYDTFYVSNLKKCLADPKLKVPLDEIRADAKLNFVEEPMKILEREFKKLK
nr:hypothetical protein [Tanacetum cinerariifolium]